MVHKHKRTVLKKIKADLQSKYDIAQGALSLIAGNADFGGIERNKKAVRFLLTEIEVTRFKIGAVEEKILKVN